jgi:hypothetical protein
MAYTNTDLIIFRDFESAVTLVNLQTLFQVEVKHLYRLSNSRPYNGFYSSELNW